MKKILILALIFIATKNVMALTNVEKYDLFYSANDIIVVVSHFSNENYYKEYEEQFDTLWKGSAKAKTRCYKNSLELDRFIKKSKKNFKDLDEKKTLILFPSQVDGINYLYYLDSKKKMNLLAFSYQPPKSFFSGSDYSYLLDWDAFRVSMNCLKSKIDLFKLSPLERKKKEDSYSSLKDLKNETIFFHSHLFDDLLASNNHINAKTFKKNYPYRCEIHPLYDKNPDSQSKTPFIQNYDSVLLIFNDTSIRYIVYTKRVDGLVHSSKNNTTQSYYNVDVFVYDKKNKTINLIDIMGSQFITEKFLRRLIRKIDKE